MYFAPPNIQSCSPPPPPPISKLLRGPWYQARYCAGYYKAIDTPLREEQACFGKGRGCTDQIFAQHNIMEQSPEWNAPLCINCIHFQKAFDSVHRESLWKILRTYGMLPKIINLIKMFYDNFEYSVIFGNTITETFLVKSGVRQDCILSPILFQITIDWLMRQTVYTFSWNTMGSLLPPSRP